MVDLTFFALSPSVYMIRPQLTEQYGQTLRVSVVRASLNWRVSAKAAVGEKPSATRLEPTSPAPLARRNCLRFMSIRGSLLRASVRVLPRLRHGRAKRLDTGHRCVDRGMVLMNSGSYATRRLLLSPQP